MIARRPVSIMLLLRGLARSDSSRFFSCWQRHNGGSQFRFGQDEGKKRRAEEKQNFFSSASLLTKDFGFAARSVPSRSTLCPLCSEPLSLKVVPFHPCVSLDAGKFFQTILICVMGYETASSIGIFVGAFAASLMAGRCFFLHYGDG